MSSSPTDQATAGTGGEIAPLAVTMPQMGVSVAEGTIVEWRKRPGDWVEADETVCVVTTDKVDVEIPAPASGRIARILIEADATVAVGTRLAEIDGGASAGEAHPDEARSRPAEVHSEGRGEERSRSGEGQGEADGAGAELDRSRFYSPVVQRMAGEHGIDLERVEGTGVGGRVRKRDLLAHLELGGGRAGSEGDGGAGRTLHTESPYVPETPPEMEPETEMKPTAERAAGPPGLPGRREPMSPMRRRIAEHMIESRRTSAHCTTIVEVDLAAVVGARAALKPAMAERGVPLTYLAFVAQAAVEALQRHPVLNASVEGSEIVYHDHIDLGIAVALEEGLIVPVIRHAERLSLEGLAASIAEVATRARDGGLEPDDVRGGTFTITNPGQFGAVAATPIINQPQVAILDLEAVVKRPVVVEDQDGGDAVAIRPMTNLCMSWDHRALDGAQAARFLGEVKERLEGWQETTR